MKLGVKIGDKAKVTTGKFKGKEAVIVGIDKKSSRIQLEGLKVTKSKDKKLHGTFHRSSLELVKEQPKAEAKEEATTEETTTPEATEQKEETATEEAKS